MSETKSTRSNEDNLSEQEILGIRGRWTARSASPGRDWDALYDQFRDAQADIGRLLRHLGAFDGPPIL